MSHYDEQREEQHPIGSSTKKYTTHLDVEVEQPPHYQVFPDVESLEILASTLSYEEFKGFCLGNTLKYRLRAGKKDNLEQDIAKADEYGKIWERYVRGEYHRG